VIGWVLLVAGIWSVWKGVTGEEPLGATGVLLVVAGLALASRRAHALAIWIGEGVITGLCLTGGVAFSSLGALMLLAYAEVLSEGMRIPARSAVIPALFLGCGIVLLVWGVRRLWRLRGLPGWRE
jgi:hypothetical protein